MKKRANTNVYLAFIIGLTGYTFISIFRLLPFDMTHVMYVCQRYMAQMPHLVSYAITVTFITLLAGLFATIWRTRRFKKTLKHTFMPIKIKDIIKDYSIKENIQIINDVCPRAFCLGILFPTIYISTALVNQLSKKELTAVLLHETYHSSKKHSLLLALFSTCEKCLLFFPVISDIKKRFEILIELDADRTASRILDERKYTIGAFKKLLLTSDAQYGLSFGSPTTIPYRINALIGQPVRLPQLSRAKLYLSVVVFILLSSLYLIPATKTEVHAGKQDIMLFCLRDRTCLNQCTSETRASYL